MSNQQAEGRVPSLCSEKLMEVTRKTVLPAMYTRLSFVRQSGIFALCDCCDDFPLIQQLQSVVAGNACLSELERPHWLFLKAQIPDEVPKLHGTSDACIEWHVFYWKLWDVESLVTNSRPAEAVPLGDAGIDIDFLESLAHPQSCLPMLRQTQVMLNEGYELRPDVKAAIDEMEKPLLARTKLRKMKPSRFANTGPTKSHHNSPISPKLRETILRRDSYTCRFCGQGPPNTSLEVNHIIPRSLIRKLNLDSTLYKSPKNLCTTCFSCNRGKSDNLAPEDIDYYRNAFASPQHPNHSISPFLMRISDMQSHKL